MSLQYLELLKQDADPTLLPCHPSDSLLSSVPKALFPSLDAIVMKNVSPHGSSQNVAVQVNPKRTTLSSLHDDFPRNTSSSYANFPNKDTVPVSSISSPNTTSSAAHPTKSLLQTRKKRATVLVAPYLRKPHRFPDRFIPHRRSDNGLAKSYRANKSLEKLSDAERNLRNNAANDSPFTSRGTTAAQRRIRNEAQRRSGHAMPRITTERGPLLPRTASDSGNRNTAASAPTQLGPVPAISDGRGRLIRSGSNAPMFYANFFPIEPPECIKDRFEHRLAAALDIDRSARTLRIALPEVECSVLDNKPKESASEQWWNNIRWAQNQKNTASVLDAPKLRDDFYCSVIAFCAITRTLAVGLDNRVYLWSEERGVTPLRRLIDEERGCYIGSLSFSNSTGGQSILAVGRSNGILSLCALNEDDDKFVCSQPHGITCVSFKPVSVFQRSAVTGSPTLTEELLVGDDKGFVFYYSIQWETMVTPHESSGFMQLLAKIQIHTEQICGIEWSPDGRLFATGANDNLCLLFDTANVFDNPVQRRARSLYRAANQPNRYRLPYTPSGSHPTTLPRESSRHDTLETDAIFREQEAISDSSFRIRSATIHAGSGITIVTEGCESQRWVHTAAVKAIAFCPWQRGLIAVGAGSNDRAIHFYHVWSGACLATINVLAQVTSLIWSKTRREIVATLGYCQPDHPFRIAVYSWPDCQQILAIPWQSDTRALYAIPYPGGPNDAKLQRSGEGERWWNRTMVEGSIVVASSDESVKFYEVWSEKARTAKNGPGGFGWSDILEGLEGAEKEGATIR